VYSYCVILSNIPFVIQRDVLVCEQSDRQHDSLQIYITAVGRCFLWCIRTPNAFVRHYSILILLRTVLTLCVSDFTLKCIGVCCISEYNRKQSTCSSTGELLADKVVRAVPDLPIRLSLGPQDPRGSPTNCGTHRVNGRYMVI